MFEVNMDNVKKYLEKIGARFSDGETNGLRQIHVFEKDAYDKQHNDPVKYGNLYVSYLRISYHGGDRLYTRYDGLCEEKTDYEIKEIIDLLTGVKEAG